MIPLQTSKFKNSNGVYFGRELFYETAANTEKLYVLYTLKAEDYKPEGYSDPLPSLRRLYLEEDDPTEFFIADKYFDGQPHWKRLCSQEWFLSVLSPLRDELSVKHQAQYLRSLRDDALKGDKVTARYLLDRVEKSDSKAGRPTKAKIKQEAEKLVKESGDVKDDFLRLREHLQTTAEPVR